MAKQTLHNKHRQNKHERHQIKRKQVKKARRKRQIREATATGRQVLYQITQTVNQFFPDLWDRVNTLTDPRKKTALFVSRAHRWLCGFICLQGRLSQRFQSFTNGRAISAELSATVQTQITAYGYRTCLVQSSG